MKNPLEKKKNFRSKNSIFIASLSVSIVILSIGFFMNFSHSANVVDSEWKHWGTCENVISNTNNDNLKICNVGKDDAQIDFILWGDSHARALATGVDLSAVNHGVAGSIVYKSGCPPLMSIERPEEQSCKTFNDSVLQYINDNSNIKTVILVARWAMWADGNHYKRETGKPARLIDINLDIGMENKDLVAIGLSRTIDQLQGLGKTVVLVKPIPEVGYDVPSAHYAATLTKRDVNLIISPTMNEYRQRIESVSLIFKSLEVEKSVKTIDPSVYLCNTESCNVVINGISLYRDDDHLSTFGSKFITPVFDSVFKNTLQM